MTKKQIQRRINQLEREIQILKGLSGYIDEIAEKRRERDKLKDMLEKQS